MSPLDHFLATDAIDRGREEFLAEAQEIVESFSARSCSSIRTSRKAPAARNLLNGRSAPFSTLKGLSGLFEADRPRVDDAPPWKTCSMRSVSVASTSRRGARRAVWRRRREPPASSRSRRRSRSRRHVCRERQFLRRLSECPVRRWRRHRSLRSIRQHQPVLTEYRGAPTPGQFEGRPPALQDRASFDPLTIDKALEALKDRARKLGERSRTCRRASHRRWTRSISTSCSPSGEDLAVLIGQLGGDASGRGRGAALGLLRPPPNFQAGPSSMGLTPLSEGVLASAAGRGGRDRPQRARDQGMARRAVRSRHPQARIT